MSETCWIVSCDAYGKPGRVCDHKPPSGGGQRGSEAGCYS